MGVFDDKKFEELDWISQAMEPIDSRLNEVLGKVPEEIIIDFKLYKNILHDSHNIDLTLDRVISYVTKQYVNEHISWRQLDTLKQCFKLEITSEDVLLDFEKQEIVGGEIKFVKLMSTMDEKVLEGLLGSEGIEAVSHTNFSGSGLSRANEIMELLGKCEHGLKTRSERKKKLVITKRLRALFKDNEWKIKDTELANKVGTWISSYISEGSLAALSNFCRLKVMTHKEQPIYSMEEVQ
jgi:hypothetical protein